jgi:hypothetical protein
MSVIAALPATVQTSGSTPGSCRNDVTWLASTSTASMIRRTAKCSKNPKAPTSLGWSSAGSCCAGTAAGHARANPAISNKVLK